MTKISLLQDIIHPYGFSSTIKVLSTLIPSKFQVQYSTTYAEILQFLSQFFFSTLFSGCFKHFYNYYLRFVIMTHSTVHFQNHDFWIIAHPRFYSAQKKKKKNYISRVSQAIQGFFPQTPRLKKPCNKGVKSNNYFRFQRFNILKN